MSSTSISVPSLFLSGPLSVHLLFSLSLSVHEYFVSCFLCCVFPVYCLLLPFLSVFYSLYLSLYIALSFFLCPSLLFVQNQWCRCTFPTEEEAVATAAYYPLRHV